MTYEEYRAAIMDLVEHPETAPKNAQVVIDAIKKDSETIDALTQTNKQQEQKIRDVQDTNVWLLKNSIGQRPQAQEETDGHIHTREDAEAFFDKLKKNAQKESEDK